MNYIKLFEAFSDDILMDIRDILFEITDNGYNIRQELTSSNFITYEITADFKFKLNDIRDTLLRLFDFNKSQIRVRENELVGYPKNLWIDIVTDNRIMGARILNNGTSNGFSYELNIGKDYRFYTPRGRLNDKPLCVSRNIEINKVSITIKNLL